MRDDVCGEGNPGRRNFLRTVFAGAVAGAATGGGIGLMNPEMLNAQTNLSPDAAFEELMAGNQRFASNQLTSLEHDLTILKEHTAGKQEPFAGVLSCADSRVPGELVFDQTIGHIFVTRVVGNVSTSDMIASLEYGVAVLGIKALLVL